MEQKRNLKSEIADILICERRDWTDYYEDLWTDKLRETLDKADSD